MAVSKLWVVKDRLDHVLNYATNPEKTDSSLYKEEDYQALKDVLAYAKNETKTEHEYYCTGINCNVSTARTQFITVKEQFQKTDGKQAYHGYLSFPEKEVTPEQCHQIGVEFAKRVWGDRFQVVVTTHLNTNHLHCHFVINSVSFVDGKRMVNRENYWRYFHHVADEICKENGLSIIEEPELTKKNDYLTNQDKAGMPTRYNLARQAIDEAISHSQTMLEIEKELREMGYGYNFSPNIKYWTITPKGYKKPIRLKNLGDEYSKERIYERVKENKYRYNEIQELKKKAYRTRQYNLPTRGDKLKKRGGIYGLYLYYCYRLGYLPKYKKQNNNRLHYLLKEDLMKLDKITEEVRLLGREKIETAEQLFSYKDKTLNEIENLTKDRTNLRNKIRTNISEDEVSNCKEEISIISDKLKSLRKDLKLCDGIAETSKIIESNLETVREKDEKDKYRKGKVR